MSPVSAEPVAVAVFARAPVPGCAKTRLIPRLGAAGAAALQRAFILRTLHTAKAADIGPVCLCCAPDCADPLFQRCQQDYDVALWPQGGGDLGARMFAAFAELCAAGPALLVGTDCPALTPAHLRDAARALREGSDAVFLPAEDGGYVLIGLRRAEAFLFADMPWGGSGVMAETRRRLRQNGWHWREPALLWDVDLPEDIDRLHVSGLMALPAEI